jgi:hypothetical protein
VVVSLIYLHLSNLALYAIDSLQRKTNMNT